jgi:hypothetical protein
MLFYQRVVHTKFDIYILFHKYSWWYYANTQRMQNVQGTYYKGTF